MPEVTSALPSAARAKLEQMQNTETPPEAPPTETPPETPPADTPPADTAQVERITLTREELNDLRAAAGTAKTLESRLEESEGRNEALMQRLTELESSVKGNPNPPTPSAPPAPTAPTVQLEQATFSDEENEQYGDSQGYVAKVARNTFVELIAPIVAKFEADLGDLKNTTAKTTSTLEQQHQSAFDRALREAVPNFRELVRHQHWNKFLDEVEEFSGQTMEQLLGAHIHKRNAAQAAKIYKRFEEKYVAPVPNQNNGAYAGALPSAGAATLPTDPNAPKAKLKLSDRKRANRDYINKKITFDQLQEINKKFEEAEKAGNVDYNS